MKPFHYDIHFSNIFLVVAQLFEFQNVSELNKNAHTENCLNLKRRVSTSLLK